MDNSDLNNIFTFKNFLLNQDRYTSFENKNVDFIQMTIKVTYLSKDNWIIRKDIPYEALPPFVFMKLSWLAKIITCKVFVAMVTAMLRGGGLVLRFR